jgi:hypothetical protein
MEHTDTLCGQNEMNVKAVVHTFTAVLEMLMTYLCPHNDILRPIDCNSITWAIVLWQEQAGGLQERGVGERESYLDPREKLQETKKIT